MSLIKELKRRNVFRVGVAYVIIAWLLLQVSDTLVPALHLPEWFQSAVALLLILGFPLALFFAWAFELTPEGLKKEKDVERSESITHVTGRKLDFAIIAMLVVALGYFGYDKFVLGPSRDAELVQTTTNAVTGSVILKDPDKTIAVLAFADLSPAGDQVYFSDGIAEEILNLLANVSQLRVTSRSSAFSFKGQNLDVPTMAAKLNVAYVLEGSVRKSGNQLRITAQLIEAETDTHLWSKAYDRELEDIFAIQDEIAARVVEQLKLTLLGDAPTVQATDPEAYALVLQARYLHRQNTPDALETSMALFEQALQIDPDYAAAWDGLALGYMRQAGQALRPVDEGYMLAREAASQALALDPAYALAHRSLARIAHYYDSDLLEAARHYERALALEPANTDSIGEASGLAASLSRLDQAIAGFEYVAAHDPVNPVANWNLGLVYLYGGRLDESIASMRTALTLSPGYIAAQYLIGTALLLKGEPETALAAMRKEESEAYRLFGLATAHYALGQAAASDEALAELIEKYEQGAAYNIAFVLAFRGEADRGFEWLHKAVAYKDTGLADIVVEPLFANIRLDARWLPFLESIGRSPEQLAAIEFKVTLPE